MRTRQITFLDESGDTAIQDVLPERLAACVSLDGLFDRGSPGAEAVSKLGERDGEMIAQNPIPDRLGERGTPAGRRYCDLQAADARDCGSDEVAVIEIVDSVRDHACPVGALKHRGIDAPDRPSRR